MDDEIFSFKNVTLESTNGKFYFETSRNKKRVYEVTHDMFKELLVLAANNEASGQHLPNQANSFEYLMSQLEMNEALFAATLYHNSQWRNK